MASNPLLIMNDDADEPRPLVELKIRLLLYTDRPPGPIAARRVYDLFMARFGAVIAAYQSTAFGSQPEDWTPESRKHFETTELPDLRLHQDWGYIFGSNQEIPNGRLFMFHGSRPESEPGWASVFRFDFEWDLDPEILRDFTSRVLETVECVWGTAGFVFCPDEEIEPSLADNKSFAWAMRYWGVQAQDLDVTVQQALSGFDSVSWLTIIGAGLSAKEESAVDRARAVAYSSFEVNGHVVIQAEERPRLIDRNRREPLGNYPAVAQSLLPLQVKDHPSFSGDLWDEDVTRRYLNRFTLPQV
jgi:hypothetical protein